MRTAASTCAFSPASCALVCALAGAAAPGCTASGEDVRAPRDQLFFPTGLAVSPDEQFLFVANANSELRYDSGSIGVIDLDVVRGVIRDWQPPSTDPPTAPIIREGCEPDPDHGETLVCDEAQFFKPDAGVRIGNFATDVAVQDFTPAGGVPRVIVPTRGDPSITWADFINGSLRCTTGTESYALCDDTHRLTSLLNDPDLAPIPSEPFGVFAFPERNHPSESLNNGFAMVTHLSTGSVTLIRAPSDSSEVAVVDVRPNVFAPDPLGFRGATGISGLRVVSDPKDPSDPSDDVAVEILYVGSSTESRIQTFTVGERDSAAAFLLPGNHFFLDAAGANAGGSIDTRGLRFSPTGERLYVVNRAPPTLQVYDTSLGPSGVPLNAATGATDICREASGLALLDAGAGERAYVTCFQDGQVYVVDPGGQSRVEDIISVGRGPYAAVAISGENPAALKLLFVSNFLEDTIAVIDVSPNSPQRDRVVLRIGQPRDP